MSTMNIYDMADEWNDAGTTFTAIKMNVTDTASSAGSLLMDLQVDGNSKFRIFKDGVISVQNTVAIGADNGWLRIFNAPTSGGFAFGFSTTGSLALPVSSGSIRWQSYAGGGADLLVLLTDADNTLAQRNGTNAQTFRLYNTFTDASNYERGFMRWNANVLEIGTEAAGTGTQRPLAFTNAAIRMSNLPTTNPAVAGQLWNDNGTLKISAG